MGSNRRIERALRRNRPEARDTFVADLAARVDGTPAAPVRPRRVRYGLAAAMTALALLVAASMGGFSYAANSVQAAGGKVVKVVKKPRSDQKRANRGAARTSRSQTRALAAFTTYTLGYYVCHFNQSRTYNKGQRADAANWTWVQLTALNVGTHMPHAGDWVYGQTAPTSGSQCVAGAPPA